MSELVDLLHDYVDQYDRVASDLECVENSVERLRTDLRLAQAANRTLLTEVAALKAERRPIKA